ncbi:MAG: MBL fold metallo-hydrolase [Dehalococcoidia bacterium]
MPHNFKDVDVIRHGDSSGNYMVLRITPRQGVPIYAISVAREGFSYTGPTWAYLFDNEGLTLIDTGVKGSFPNLNGGLNCAGFQARDIERVIVTHGHEDHDGAVAELVGETNAELWAHEIYALLLDYDPRDIQRRPVSSLQWEMRGVARANDAVSQPDPERASYLEHRRHINVARRIKAGDRAGNLTFMSAPGHSPDELCVTLDGVVFTGDHVLPEITPHPTTKTVYAPEIKQLLPDEYHQEDEFYGLETYLRSLKLVADLGERVSVLPAHRLYNRDKFNFLDTRRAAEIIQHHATRLSRLLARIGTEPTGLEQVTRGIFEHRKLMGGNLMAALSEMVAHIEVLQDTRDLEFTDEREIRWTGSDNYRQLLQELTTVG